MKTTIISVCLLVASALAVVPVSAQFTPYVSPARQAVYEPTYRHDGSDRKVKNVILLVGDGMGLAHMTAALHANGGDLTIARMHHIGLVRTQSANRYITDSAAAGTAYATGCKTRNGSLGVDTAGCRLPDMTEILSARGYATGIVSTDKISGATPSAFYTHQPQRSMTREILSDLLRTRALFVAGSSVSLFNSMGKERLDSLRAQDFTVLHDFKALPLDAPDKVALIACDRDAAQIKDGRDTAYLRSVTRYALSFLSQKSKKGFFLMVEGAEIDHAAHNGDIEGVVRETLDFDKAVAEALRFADTNGETLVIVLADHETGGLALGDGDILQGKVSGHFATGGHSPILVPVYAYGPHADDFCGVIDNTEVFARILSALNVKR